jgi:4-hydroxy-tetrahydrodipicolinate synthase
MSIEGIWVPIVTPFRSGQVDFAALKRTAIELFEAGISGIVVCGTTGEPATMSDEEQLAVLDAVLEVAPSGRVAMGLSDNSQASALERLKRICERAVAGVLVPAPYYIRPSQTGLIEYFCAIADASSVPIIVYNIPYRTGVAMELATLRAIAAHERVVAIKDCGGDLGLTMQLIADGNLAVLTGEDQQALVNLALGGAGVIAAAAHIRPDLWVRLPKLVKEGKLDEARSIFYRLLPMIHLAFREPNPGPVKAALAMLGKMSDELRAPMQAATPAVREAWKTILQDLELPMRS